MRMKAIIDQASQMCPLCGETRVACLPPSVSPTPNLHCIGCGLIFQPSVDPDERRSYYYSSGYHKRSANRSVRRNLVSRSLLLSSAEKKLRNLEKKFNIVEENIRVLDIGCGYGALLAVWRDSRKCDVLGVEPSHQACVLAKDWFDLDLVESTLEDVCLETRFERILAVHCLEHAQDPIAFLKQCGRFLAPSGKLYVECPNLYRPTAGFSWPRFFERDHLFQFTPVTLRMAAAQAGWRIRKLDEQSHLRVVMDQTGPVEAPTREQQQANAKRVAAFISAYPKLRWTRLYPLRRALFLLYYLAKLSIYKGKDALTVRTNKSHPI